MALKLITTVTLQQWIIAALDISSFNSQSALRHDVVAHIIPRCLSMSFGWVGHGERGLRDFLIVDEGLSDQPLGFSITNLVFHMFKFGSRKKYLKDSCEDASAVKENPAQRSDNSNQKPKHPPFSQSKM